MQDTFEWPEPEPEADEVILRNVRNHGCHIVGIPDAAPPFAFSIGLFLNYGHPELIIFGQRSENAHAIINLVRDRVAEGHKFVDGDISGDLLENDYKLGFWQVPFEAYPNISARRSGSTPSPGAHSPACKSSGRTSIGTFPGRWNAYPM
ncbi:DUF4262 domain-containing protein [Bradyrhizobium canariense]|nr:DUF4262 domain-containing protein [Bradyrhizobium canariense]MBR0955570.1 DUF4262 domain-containing protein [Bradyrhizobium canariense]